ncbi:MAG: hypothetical protein ABR599_03560 [Gemmatimonadota bacterium]
MKLAARTLLLLAGAAAAACSAGGSPSGPVVGATSVSFVPDGSALNNAVALSLQTFDEQSVTLDVVLRNATQPVTGVAVELQYEPTALSSLGGSAGPFLTGATTVSRAVAIPRSPGKLVAVFTQRDLYRGNVGSGTLGSFTLKLDGGAFSSPVRINAANSTLFGPGGVPLTGDNFSGGTLDVRRGN